MSARVWCGACWRDVCGCLLECVRVVCAYGVSGVECVRARGVGVCVAWCAYVCG